jgi:hypothetical protein
VERLDKAVAELRAFVYGLRHPPDFDLLSARVVLGLPITSRVLGHNSDNCVDMPVPEAETIATPVSEAETIDTTISAMKRGLFLIVDRIKIERRIAKETLLRLGATRKSQIDQAGPNAAAAWLANGVHRITGKPHLREVIDLLQVILETEFSEDRVKHAARKRNREWPPRL